MFYISNFRNLSFVQNIPQDAGAVVVTSHQIRGRGRGGNMWLSPLGCMMFSLHVRVDFNTELGSRLPFLQHIASLAVVEAVRTLPGYEVSIKLLQNAVYKPPPPPPPWLLWNKEQNCSILLQEINICLKWPNDIYFGRDVKIGGVIVTSSACNGRFSAVIGWWYYLVLIVFCSLIYWVSVELEMGVSKTKISLSTATVLKILAINWTL